MFKLDNQFLTSLGLGNLPVDEKNKLLQHIYERLEINVGMRLAEKMTDSQLDEFEGFIDRNDESGALRWLETNFPNYKEVVAEELEKLKKEVSEAAPQILAAAQLNGAQAAHSTIGDTAPQQPLAVPPAPYPQPAMQPPTPSIEQDQPITYASPNQPFIAPNEPMNPVQPNVWSQPDMPTQQPPAGFSSDTDRSQQ